MNMTEEIAVNIPMIHYMYISLIHDYEAGPYDENILRYWTRKDFYADLAKLISDFHIDYDTVFYEWRLQMEWSKR